MGGLCGFFISGILWEEGSPVTPIPSRDGQEGAEAPQVVTTVAKAAVEWAFFGYTPAVEWGGVGPQFEEVANFSPRLVIFEGFAVCVYVVVWVVFGPFRLNFYLCDLQGV